MAERRPLTEGLKTPKGVDPEKEAAFVFGQPANGAARPKEVKELSPMPNYREESSAGPMLTPGRVLLSARVNPELASKLKRVSLERQLAGKEPNSQQEIIEIALANWLHENGYQ